MHLLMLKSSLFSREKLDFYAIDLMEAGVRFFHLFLVAALCELKWFFKCYRTLQE